MQKTEIFNNNLFIEFDLTQVYELATRNGNLLDLVFTTNPTLVKSSVNAPGISDHDVIVTDTDMKPIYKNQKPRKIYLYKKANLDATKEDRVKVSNDISKKTSKIDSNIEDI